MKAWALTPSTDDTRGSRGFTIVELLIVIIVIGILSALILIGYNNVTNQAKASAAKNDLEQVAKQLNLYKEQAGAGTSYPSDASSLAYSSGTTLQYSVNNAVNPATYCVTATNGNVSYYLSNTSQVPVAGGCPGHGVNGASPVTNLATNPSAETTAMTFNNGGGATAVRDSTNAYSGTWSILLTKASNYCFVSSGGSYGVGGDTVTVSAWVKSSTSSVLMVQRGGGVPYGAITKAVTANTWTRVSNTYTVPAGATSFSVDFGWEGTTAPSGSTLNVDAIMATSGSTLYGYADGSSTGWIWNGTANASTSTGSGS